MKKINSKISKTVILGAGLSGLTLGYLMKQKGEDFEILEKEKQCGGLMRTFEEQGFTFDGGGSHVIFSKNIEVMNFMLNLLGENKIMNRRNSKILYKGRYVKYPFENGLSDLDREENFECLNSFVQNLITKEKDKVKRPSNLKEWFFYNFGSGIAEKYLIPYNEKIWKYAVENMSLDWVDRLPNPPVEDIIKSALGLKTEGYTHQLHFFYPVTGGIETITRSLESKIGGRIITDFEVKHLKKEDNLWVVSDGKTEKIYNKIISTIPIQKLISLLNPEEKIKTACANLKYNSIITVMIGLNSHKLNDFSWIYIPDHKILSHRLSFPSNYSPKVTPPRKSSVLAEITCNLEDKIWTMSDGDLITQVINDLHDLNLLNKMDVCFTKLQRTNFAYVINDNTYTQNLNIVKRYLSEVGIDSVGRFAEFRYLNMDGCIESAMSYVQNRKNLG